MMGRYDSALVGKGLCYIFCRTGRRIRFALNILEGRRALKTDKSVDFYRRRSIGRILRRLRGDCQSLAPLHTFPAKAEIPDPWPQA